MTEHLGYMPLAIEHAGTFMKNMNVPISEYLDYYRRAFRGVHKDPATPGWGHHSKTVATTWEVSFEAVQKKDPAAAELLLMCSFINNQDIPEELFNSDANIEGDNTPSNCAHSQAEDPGTSCTILTESLIQLK